MKQNRDFAAAKSYHGTSFAIFISDIMLRPLKTLFHYNVYCQNDNIGHIENFFFNDENWVVRYLVINTGNWFTGKRILVSPFGVKRVDLDNHEVHLSISLEQVKKSPDLETTMPLSRTKEMEYYNYYHWPKYWSGAGIWGIAPTPAAALNSPVGVALEADPITVENIHLRDFKEVVNYSIATSHEKFGHLEDFLLDDESWVIQYITVHLRAWLPSQTVVISTETVEAISWSDKSIRVLLSKDQIMHSPKYEPTVLINRDFEERLYHHFEKEKYKDKMKDFKKPA